MSEADGTSFVYDGVIGGIDGIHKGVWDKGHRVVHHVDVREFVGAQPRPQDLQQHPLKHIFNRTLSVDGSVCRVTLVPLSLPSKKDAAIEDYDVFFVRIRIAGREGSYRRTVMVKKRGSDDLFSDMASELCERRREKKLAPLWDYELDPIGTVGTEG